MFSVLGASAVLLPAAALWLAAQALQPQPIAAPGAPLAISDLNAARRLISREVLSQAFQGEPLTLALTASQAQALAQDMGARVLHAPSSLHLSEQQADLAVSLPIRQTPLRALHPLGDWLNVRVRLSAPPSGAPRRRHRGRAANGKKPRPPAPRQRHRRPHRAPPPADRG